MVCLLQMIVVEAGELSLNEVFDDVVVVLMVDGTVSTATASSVSSALGIGVRVGCDNAAVVGIAVKLL